LATFLEYCLFWQGSHLNGIKRWYWELIHRKTGYGEKIIG